MNEESISNLITIATEIKILKKEKESLQQENKQLKELCDKYEKEHLTTFQIWLTSIDEYRKQKSLLDKIKEYCDELITKYQYDLEHLDRNKNLYEKGAYDETNCILEDLEKLKGE